MHPHLAGTNMSFNEEENNNPFPSGISDKDYLIEVPIDEAKSHVGQLSDADTVLDSSLNQLSHRNHSALSESHNITKLYSQKIEDLLVNSPNAEDTEITIIEATKSNENDHPATSRSYIIYTIKIADDIIVKRRYSEFENLRNLLVKLFPSRIVPPIPEKQSIKSNFSLTGIQLSALKSTSSDSSNKTDFDTTDYVDYRKRLLTSFIRRCIRIEDFRKNFIFLTFLDPHPNFNEFIHLGAVGKLNAASIFKLSPVEPLKSLEDELYISLPAPSEHSSIKIESNDNQLSEYTLFEAKFKEYESILSNISKYNKHIIKSMAELSMDYTEVGLYFNSLSLEEDSSPIIEKIGQVFDSSFFDVNLLRNLINLKFLEKVIELRNFIKVVRSLIAYNKRKWLQSVEIRRLLKQNNSILGKEKKLDNLSRLIDDAMSKSRVLNSNKLKSDIAAIPDTEDEESLRSLISQLQDARITPSSSNKLFGYSIPGLKRVNKAILSMSDPNPDQTRKETIAKTKLKILTLRKQYDIVTRDNKFIDEAIRRELTNFQDWFKLELNALNYEYSKDLKEFFSKSQESWEASNPL